MPKTPRELAERMAVRRARQGRVPKADDGFVRETFREPRANARKIARAFFDRFPKQAYMSEVERWCELPGGAIEFTMRRLPSAD